MKKTLISLMLLAAVLFTSACVGNKVTAEGGDHNINVSVKKGKNDDGNKKSKKFSDYLSAVNESADRYVADFDLNQFLLDTGAIEIKRLEDEPENYSFITALYPNGVAVRFGFSIYKGDNNFYGHLEYVYVFVASDSYDIAQTDSNQIDGLRSEWVHYFTAYTPSELTNDPKDDDDPNSDKQYVVKPGSFYYIDMPNGDKHFLTVPMYFEKAFKASILPYLKVKDPSFRVDPFEGQIGGTTET